MNLLVRIGHLRRLALFQARLTQIPHHGKSKKKRIAIVTGELEVGGVGRVLLNIVRALPEEDFEITIFTTDPRLNAWSTEFKKHVRGVIDIPKLIGRSLGSSYVKNYLVKYLQRNAFDVIFITNSMAGYVALPHVQRRGASARARVYDLLHTHGLPGDDDAFLKLSMPYDAYITERVVISDYLKRYYCEHYPVDPNKIQVIYNGIDEASVNYQPDKSFGENFLGLNPDERAITYLGRLQEDKSPERLVDLAYRLKQELTARHTFIAVVGEGSLERSLRERATELGVLHDTIRFFPFTDRPLDILAASEFSILTSNLEGIPMSALESMQVRTPLIAPSVGGLPDIVDDGKDGLLAHFTENDTEDQRVSALAQAIHRALSLSPNHSAAMRTAAHRKIKEKFCSMATAYRSLFKVE